MSLIDKIKAVQKLNCENKTSIEILYKKYHNVRNAFDASLTKFVEDRFIRKYSNIGNIEDINLLVLIDENFNFHNYVDATSRGIIENFILEARNFPYYVDEKLTMKMMIDSWVARNKQYIVDDYNIEYTDIVNFNIKYINPDFIYS